MEQIPEENFDEKSVTDFFSVFGSISEVTLQPYKRLALVKFEDYHAARAAYESPRVIFDNRFVKVYWYNPNLPQHKAGANGEGKASSPTSATNSTEPAFDREEFERSSQAAQKKLEERKALQQQNEVKKAELEKAKKELEARQAAEKQKLLEKLKAKGLVTDDVEMSLGSPKPDPSASQETSKTSAQTEALRAQLKALEDEARSLGIDPHGPETYASTTYSPRGRGRGRARGGYRGYPGGYDPNYRGRGRGVFQGTVRAGGAFNLDNRPRRVKVDGVEWDDEKEENLKQYLIVSSLFPSFTPLSITLNKYLIFLLKNIERRRLHLPKYRSPMCTSKRHLFSLFTRQNHYFQG